MTATHHLLEQRDDGDGVGGGEDDGEQQRVVQLPPEQKGTGGRRGCACVCVLRVDGTWHADGA
eukprot:3201015-Prymnesium_polylepis.1